MAAVLGLLVWILSLDGAFTAFDDIFRDVERKNKENGDDGVSGRVSRPLWCDYNFPNRDESLIKVQYDMVLDRARYDDIIDGQFYFVNEETSCETKPIHKRNAVSDQSKLWKADIPYDIIDFDAADEVAILKSMQIWSSYTCVNFVPSRDSDFDKIQFIKSDWGCESFVGRMQGPQPVFLASPGCTQVPIILHELGHVLGLYHEHMRPDRDDYVTVHYENINETRHVQFDTLKNGSTKTYGKKYDYLSVMHYGKYFYADGPDLITLEPKNSDFLDIIGEVETLSFLDIKIVNQMYNCEGGCKAKLCPENAFMGKDCRCYCPGPSNKYPIQRCDPIVSCEAPAIDMSIFTVYTANGEPIDSLVGKLYPDGTVLRLSDYLCVIDEVGNYTCVGGVWTNDVTACEHEGCLLDETRYVFKPLIDEVETLVSKHGDIYARSGSDVSVACKSKSENERVYRETTCRGASWDIVMPHCEEVLECIVGDYSEDNIELYFEGEKLEWADFVPEGSEIVAQCNATDDGMAGSSTVITCADGKLEGDFPEHCPNEIFRCPMIPYTAMSGPFSEGYLIKCLENYELEQPDGTSFFKCGWKGDWQPYEPTCIPEKCTVTYDSEAGTVTDSNDVIPSGTRIRSDVSVSLSCMKGHFPDNQQLTCSFGKFKETDNGQMPVCKYVECTPPALPATLKYRPRVNKYVYKDEIIMRRCENNLWFRGDATITCGQDGQWTGTGECVPFCQPDVGEEKNVPFQHSNITGRVWSRMYGIGSYAGCQEKCRTFKRILCRAFAFGYLNKNPKCQITYRNPIISPEVLQEQPYWTVWARDCVLH